jgi:hypothetical protein
MNQDSVRIRSLIVPASRIADEVCKMMKNAVQKDNLVPPDVRARMKHITHKVVLPTIGSLCFHTCIGWFRF